MRIKNSFKFTILNFILISGFFFNCTDILFAQKDGHNWKLNFSYINMIPNIGSQPWIRTQENYDVIPICNEYTPGFELGLEHLISNTLGIELSIIYGIPNARLKLEGENIENSNVSRRFNYSAFLINPILYFPLMDRFSLYLGPHFGYGIFSKNSLYGGHEPRITFGDNSSIIYGAKAGINWKMINDNLLLNVKVQSSHMDLKISANSFNLLTQKNFGPLSLSLGIQYYL